MEEEEKIHWDFWIVLFIGFIFGIAGYYLGTTDFPIRNVAGSFETTYFAHKLIGFIGILFAQYIFYLAGKLRVEHNKEKK